MAPKMKRRDLDEADDEFFEFSLSSPATKIRRLDAEVAPIAEKEERPFEIEEAMEDSSLDLPLTNEERAIVLYKPIYSHLLLSPNRSNVSLQISSDLIISGLKNGFFQRGKGGSPVDDRRAAVVPWAPVSPEAADMAEEGASMEVEEEQEEAKQAGTSNGVGGGGVGGEGFHPWQRQRQWQWQNHCVEPQQQQRLLNPTTPMMWSS